MRLIDADVFRLRLASIAKTFARTDAQRSLMGRCIYCLDKTTTVAEWVSVRERLPRSLVNKVIVWLEHKDLVGYIGFGHYEKFQGVEMWYDLEHGEQFAKHGYTVTYWMPLPEPPKEDEDV